MMEPSPTTTTGIGNTPQRLGSSADPSPPLPTFHHRWDDVNEWEYSDIRGDIAGGWEGEGAEERRSNVFPGAAIGRANNGGFVGSGCRGKEGVVSSLLGGGGWNLDVRALRPLPPFYPLDARATRRIILMVEEKEDAAAEEREAKREVGGEAATDEHHLRDISQRLSEACRHLSIQVDWDNLRPSAKLFTMEQVEMEISLYSEDSHAVAANAHSWARMMPAVPAVRKPPPAETTAATVREDVSSSPPLSYNRAHLLVEVQRRKGCPITFQSYLRNLLDAAEGNFDPIVFHQTDGLEKPGGRDRCNAPRASLLPSRSNSKLGRRGGSGGRLARPTLRPPSFSADNVIAFTADGLKTTDDGVTAAEGLEVKTSSAPPTSDPTDKALEALNIAASLIKKDRMDARRLGMESLVLLTNPTRAGMETARIASRVVLLGTAREELAFKPIDGEDEDVDIDALFDESAGLGIRETLLEMITGDDCSSSDDDMHSQEGIDKEFTDCLFHLCLSVLSNALEVLEGKQDVVSAEPPTHIVEDDDCENDRKPSPTNRQSVATETAVHPSMDSRLSKKFIDDTNSTFGCDVLSSLIRILGQAKHNPHDAYHSARCLGVLFKGCGNSHKARAQRDLNAKRIISAALDVGSRTHAKLYDASQAAMTALVTDDEEIMKEENTDRGVQEMTNEGDDEMEEEATEKQQQSLLQHRPSPTGKDLQHGQY